MGSAFVRNFEIALANALALAGVPAKHGIKRADNIRTSHDYVGTGFRCKTEREQAWTLAYCRKYGHAGWRDSVYATTSGGKLYVICSEREPTARELGGF